MPDLVTGTIEFPANTESFTDVTIYIRLESVGLLDMPAHIITESTQRNISYEGSALPFSLNGDVTDNPGPFSVQVHVSLHGTGNVKKGDYVTKRAHNVLQNKNPDHIIVRVEKV